MKSKLALSMSTLLFVAISGTCVADDDASKQIQMLNTQIQAQLQQIQEAQKKHDKDFNTQIQTQLKQLQSDIQKEISDGYNKTQDQIKKVQDTFQAQIKQISEDVQKASKASTTTTTK